MLTTTFGLPIFEVGDEVVKVIEESQKVDVQHWEEKLFSAVKNFLSDTNCVPWFTDSNATVRDSDTYGFKVPYDFECIPAERREYIL
jgi:hypothetical protein